MDHFSFHIPFLFLTVQSSSLFTPSYRIAPLDASDKRPSQRLLACFSSVGSCTIRPSLGFHKRHTFASLRSNAGENRISTFPSSTPRIFSNASEKDKTKSKSRDRCAAKGDLRTKDDSLWSPLILVTLISLVNMQGGVINCTPNARMTTTD